jgi:hypothetical protein
MGALEAVGDVVTTAARSVNTTSLVGGAQPADSMNIADYLIRLWFKR